MIRTPIRFGPKNWINLNSELANSGKKHLESRSVETALRNDYVGVSLAWFDKSLVSGPDRLKVLIDDALRSAAAVGDVSSEAPNEPDIGRSVDKNLEVESLAQCLIPENEDSVNHDDLLGANGSCVAAAIVFGVVVDWHFDGRSIGERSHVVVQERPVECIGVVIIRSTACLERLVTPVEVVRVEFDP